MINAKGLRDNGGLEFSHTERPGFTASLELVIFIYISVFILTLYILYISVCTGSLCFLLPWKLGNKRQIDVRSAQMFPLICTQTLYFLPKSNDQRSSIH